MKKMFFLICLLCVVLFAASSSETDNVLITVSGEKWEKFYAPDRVVKVDFLDGKKPGTYIRLSGYINSYDIFFFIDDSSHLAKFFFAPECILKDLNYEEVDECAWRYIKKNKELFLRNCTKVNGPIPDESYKKIVDFIKKEYPDFYLNNNCKADSEYNIDLFFRSPNKETYSFSSTSCEKLGETFKRDPVLKPVFEVFDIVLGIADKDVGECECKCPLK